MTDQATLRAAVAKALGLDQEVSDLLLFGQVEEAKKRNREAITILRHALEAAS